LLLALALPWFSPGIATFVFLAIAVAAAAGQYWLWHQGLVLHGATLFAAAFMIYLWNMALGFYVEAQAKRKFTDLFGQYVPPELVEKMAENPERYDMKGQRKELTVMFSDVRGFTSISERLSPSDLATYINEYLTGMSLIIRQEGGTLDKYIGDAIMAFWGAPVDEPRHALSGVRAALRMRLQIGVLSESFRSRNWPEPEIGVGLSSGDMTVGDMGSVVRKAYTVMGDAVNVGSRLEGLTRQYGAFCLVSEATKKACPEVVFRQMDIVRVKGKAEPVSIYEPVCLVEDATDIVYKELALWHEALDLLSRQQWDRALEVLATSASMYGDDSRVRILREKISRLKADPPGRDWDGITNFDTK
jgi:adenylate cyclase